MTSLRVDPHEHEDIEPPDVSAIVTEDDTPVDNLYSAKQQRLLVAPLYTAWTPGPGEDGQPRRFLADSNVGLFPALREPPLVPDAFLSMDVEPRQPIWEKRNRSYFFWEFGKPPEVVIEVVSNREGGELTEKKRRYARMRIAHYVVWDPELHLGGPDLQAFELRGDFFVPSSPEHLASAHLGLVRWAGTFETMNATWLRWTLPEGTLIATPEEFARAARSEAEAEREKAGAERGKAEAEREKAEAERVKAEVERGRAARLAARLRELGVDPDEV